MDGTDDMFLALNGRIAEGDLVRTFGFTTPFFIQII